MIRRRQTMIGVPAPAHLDAGRASVRYSIRAPETAIGAVLVAMTQEGTQCCVEVVEREDGLRTFVDVDGVEAQICRWRAASQLEVDGFVHERRARRWADYASIHGAPALFSKLKSLPMPEREAALVATSGALRARGMPGKAEQVDVYRFTGES